MIIGIGIDIIEIIRVKKIYDKLKNIFAKKILNKNEYIKYKFCKNKIYFLAKHFSVKEATFKAIGTGIRNGLSFKDIEIYKNKLGKPMLKFYKNSKIIINNNKVNKVHVSISDERNYALSVVILES